MAERERIRTGNGTGPMRIAILGANGFIGGRAVEMLHLSGQNVRPIVRSFNGLARLSRFNLDCRIADARSESALREAFDGCDIVLHAVSGDPEMIDATLAPVYRAAQECGVRRLVYLSTASVHGQAPKPGSDESSRLHQNHLMPYNNAKVRAERGLLNLRAHGKVELVMLRPGIVFGPRSRWVEHTARDLMTGRAYLVGDGTGICNSIYVDNVVHAIQLAIRADAAKVDRQAFLIGDAEEVTWLKFYTIIADALKIDPAGIHRLPPVLAGRTSWKDGIRKLRSSKFVRALTPMFPARFKAVVKAALADAAPQRGSHWEVPSESVPAPTLEMCLLHQCRWRFPNEKARRCLGYAPIVSFEEGCRRSTQWLGFVGYPVKKWGRHFCLPHRNLN